MASAPNQRGQTIPELLVALGVIAIILSMTTALFLQLFNHYGKVSADVDAQSEARFAMGRAADELRQAGTDPNQPPGQLAVQYPTPPSGTPSPVNDLQFTEAHAMPTDANYNNVTYDNVEITTAASPPPGHVYPDLLLMKTYNGTTTTSILGRDVKSFQVLGVTESIYDLQITCVPPEGIINPNSPQEIDRSAFTVNTRVFISYYQ